MSTDFPYGANAPTAVADPPAVQTAPPEAAPVSGPPPATWQNVAKATGPKDIFEAISILQHRLPVIEKTATNPHFGSQFTPLEDVAKRVFPILHELHVAVLQPLEDSGREGFVRVRTILHHWPSGTKVESVCDMPAVPGKGQQTQHAFGSSISYARRYSLTAILGIVCGQEDDDGGAPPPPPSTRGMDNAGPAPPPPNPAAQRSPEEEMLSFRQWIKTICPTKEDFAALCNWLALEQMPGVTAEQVLTNIEAARALGRTVTTILKGGMTREVMMQNAWHHANKSQQQGAAY